ncbi:glycerophosphodiester phosphodiesterase [Actomonas aquatica]|uniref:glycerophosphodiester phosphodiesterase n=1 Tax=Actomonas aquatica TaxID=2866162 RepID=A0ABZ1C6Y6_9BACT|nr:glycerophosphodiester phosphodiesterase [Opitutus sp. WL0086]WRQ87479.1 glycerophosphodiester phosphodiesterase [Opitutus sp. WL0086]
MTLAALASTVLACALMTTAAAASSPLVIAHRGASGVLPEHTLPAAAFAYAQGADYIEQDLVMSRDDVLVVLHDIHLDTTTDVATRYPSRHREDGRFYAIDFDWAELQTLTVRERFDPRTGEAVFPQRFPSGDGPFRLCRMEDQIQLIQGLNHSTGRTVGLYPEIKDPAWHHSEGKDPGTALIALLAHYGYDSADDPVFVQCFDPAELKRLRRETGTTLPFIQLTGGDLPLTDANLTDFATYAQGIGPHLGQILRADGQPQPAVAAAHARGLLIHPYTVRADALPPGVPHIDVLLDLLLHQAKVDGVFTDHAAATIAFLRR